MKIICRTSHADELRKLFSKRYFGDKIKLIVLMVVLFVIGVFSWGFAALDGSLAAKALAVVSLFGFIASLFLLIRKMTVKDRDFKAFVATPEGIVFVDCASAFADNRVFGAMYNINYRGSTADDIKAERNLDRINTASKYDDFIMSAEVWQMHGYLVKEVLSVSEGKQYVKIRFRRRSFSMPDSSLGDMIPMTVHIPVDYTNLDELLMKLRSMIPD